MRKKLWEKIEKKNEKKLSVKDILKKKRERKMCEKKDLGKILWKINEKQIWGKKIVGTKFWEQTKLRQFFKDFKKFYTQFHKNVAPLFYSLFVGFYW